MALIGVFVLLAFNGALDARLATIDLPEDALRVLDTERIRLAGAQPPPGLGAELHAAVTRAINEAIVTGFRVAMLISAGLAFSGALFAALMIDPKRA